MQKNNNNKYYMSLVPNILQELYPALNLKVDFPKTQDIYYVGASQGDIIQIDLNSIYLYNLT